MTIFDWLNQISYEKKPWSSFTSDDQGSFSPFMINRFISMKGENIELVNLVQKYQYLPKDQLYNFYCKTIPKKKTFFKYIKPSKKTYNQEVIDKLASFFSISTREAIEFEPLLSKVEIQNILSTIGISDKEIKKLLK
jgi:hypothetical protein